VLPTVTFPKDTLAGETANCPAAAPVPETDKDALVGADCGFVVPSTAFALSEASPLTATLPLTAPTDFGANMMVKDAV
jgi:hypothetical protein